MYSMTYFYLINDLKHITYLNKILYLPDFVSIKFLSSGGTIFVTLLFLKYNNTL